MTSKRASSWQCESQLVALARPRRFDLAIARVGCRDQRIDQAARDGSDILDGAIEHSLVCLRRRVEAAELAHELQRGIVHFGVGRGRIEVEQGFDVAAHGHRLTRYLCLLECRKFPDVPTPCLLSTSSPNSTCTN